MFKVTTYWLVLSSSSSSTGGKIAAAAASFSFPFSTITSTQHSIFASATTATALFCSSSASSVESSSNVMNTLKVLQFPCLSDNYGYLLHCPKTGQTAAIDTPDGEEYDKQLKQRQWTLTHIFNTHHHFDHVGGNAHLLSKYPNVAIYGPATERIPGMTHPVSGGHTFSFGDNNASDGNDNNNNIHVLDVGGHTAGHIAYYLPTQQKLFCGDALFALGCGRMFEGTPQQFWSTLLRLRALPDDTAVYCAHEYTAANAKFAMLVEPNNVQLQQRVEQILILRAQNLPTVPSLLRDEKATNPFLRCDFSAEIQQNVGLGLVANANNNNNGHDTDTAVEAFAKTRAAKDHFRG